jgi:hypothetical protein
MMKRIFLTLLVVTGILVLARTARAADQTIRDKYRVVQVDRFEVSEGVQFPADYILTLQEDVIQELRKSKSFGEVLHPGENPTDPSAPVLRLGGTITHFDPGSRKKRYIGYGLGQAKILARLTFSDRATGQTVVVQQIEGALISGFMGGNSKNVTREFGKTVARNAKILLEKRLPAPGETPVPETAAAIRSEKAERHVITITSKDFEGSTKKLNEEAAQGFRLAEFVVAGKNTAELTMEKIPVLTRPPEYRIIHARRIGTLEKNLNTAAAEGFCLSPHTLGVFGGWTVVIAEKAAQGGTSPRQYRIHSTMRISALQHDIQKDQAEGYKLATTWEYPAYGHMAILEKTTEKSTD